MSSVSAFSINKPPYVVVPFGSNYTPVKMENDKQRPRSGITVLNSEHCGNLEMATRKTFSKEDYSGEDDFDGSLGTTQLSC
jgi:hypothetical protein